MKADDVVNKILLTALNQFYKEWPFRVNISYAELGVKSPENYFLMNNDMPEVKEYHLNYELLETTIESLKRENLITFSSKAMKIFMMQDSLQTRTPNLAWCWNTTANARH